LRPDLKWNHYSPRPVTPDVRRVKIGYAMLTFLDDPDLVRFLRSMPYRSRRDISIRAVGQYYVLAFGLLFVTTCILLGFVGRSLGSNLGVENMGSFIGVLVGGGVVGCWVAIYRNQRLRNLIAEESHDGLLVRCPVCMKRQASDARLNCECGCIVRPFEPSGT
jgi:hypothetical protein